MPKPTKYEVNFERVCKEIDLLSKKIKEADSQASIRILKPRVNNCEDILTQAFDNLSPKENSDNIDVYLKYKEIICDLLIELEEKTKIEPRDAGVESQVKQTSVIRLPKFELPLFFGDSENWVSFKELFRSSILENGGLSKIEKLQFLNSSVRGKAAKLIRGFALTEENLDHCWAVLCERFENRRHLAVSQINKIFSTKITKAINSKTILELLDTCNESVRNLSTLGLESNLLSDLILINFLLTKLDSPLKQRWELMLDNDKIPDLELFRNFLEREARSIDESKSNRFEPNKHEPKFGLEKRQRDSGFKTNVINSAITRNVNGNNCIMCKQSHALFKCPVFNAKPVKERWKIIEENNFCQNCLRSNHKLQACRINVNCKNCAQNHHTLLHIYSTNQSNRDFVSNNGLDSSVSNSAQSNLSSQNYNVLLSTATINVKSSTGRVIQCRALLDNASQNSLISKDCVDKLGLSLFRTSHKLIGVNGISAETCLNSTECSFSPHFSRKSYQLNALVVNRVTTPLPNFRLTKIHWPHIDPLNLADPEFHKAKPIDVLLGADCFATLVTGSPIHGHPGEPAAIPTELGHILSGPVYHQKTNSTSVVCHSQSIHLKEFFNVESVPTTNTSNNLDPAEELYKNTTKRNSEGRYIVKLPFKEQKFLGKSDMQALHSFYSLETRLGKNPELKKSYIKFMQEYLQLGHMELVKAEDLNSKQSYYLPHHPVINNNSLTTKLRVVFNASAKSSNGQSLNSILLTGPKLQTNIFEHLMKFRLFKIALTADIEKMYRQILISPEDRKFQRIFWRENPSDPLLIYTLKTVTYGESCAPFLALRTIQQLCEDEKHNFPIASPVAKEHMYVDDFLGGSDSVESAKSLVNKLQSLFQSGGFQFRKWASNEPLAIQHLPESLKASGFHHSLNPDSSQRVLGLEWNLQNDSLKVQVVEEKPVTTKRELLSIIARIFDPLGLLSPSTVLLKLLMQEVWKEKLNWDDNLSLPILNIWNKFNSEMLAFNDMHIPRYLNINSSSDVEIHGFCDASPHAYAAVVYFKVISDTVTISLAAAKTRVAPVKPITLPKLELCGALLLSELVTAIQKSLTISHSVFLWSDSTIALSWIANPPAKGNQFVQHRVEKINKLTATDMWRHIPGKLNPADCASRGLFPAQLRDNDQWWLGPSWLYSWSCNSSFGSSIISEAKTFTELVVASQNESKFDLLGKFSSFTQLCRVTAWIHRFITNVRSTTKVTGPLSIREINHACKTVVKSLQNEFFSHEIKLLRQNKPISTNSRLISLNVFLDEENILRVGGRLSKHQTLNYNTKHPMLIPKGHNVTAALIREYHAHCLHGGPDLVLSLIRQKYWIIDGKSTVKKELRQCMLCARLVAKSNPQLMGDLPTVRISPCRVFENVGVDYAGPITTKCQHKRKSTNFKSYLCLFICMSTKAVHIELVSELTTAAFLCTLKRFISRRGYPKNIYSDNGKNFVGAAAYLKELYQLSKESAVQTFASHHKIIWHFMPPYGPNFGGLWESTIKSAKRHLIKTCQGLILTFEELSTLLCMIESCLNSRPLTPLSTDPNDLNALTPGHFIIGEPLIALPDHSSITNQPLSLCSRWKSISAARHAFWRQWTRDYLHHLSIRNKWKRQVPPVHEGDLVLLKQVHTTPQKWTLARIITLHPGDDGLPRVATVKTSDGIYKRPIQQLALLPDSICSSAGEVMESK